MRTGSNMGSYRLIHCIGEGSMGRVYVAEHERSGHRAAVKVLHEKFLESEEQVSRFFNEARALSRIDHPGILEVYDSGWHDQQAYFAMELLEGESLEQRLQRLGRVSSEYALLVAREIAAALSAAHQCGVIHRDLKPDNIFIAREHRGGPGERIKILDFGIAKLLGGVSRTRVGALIGTPDYMSPEQCRGAAYAEPRSDLYAVGGILFRLLCGRPPFGSGSISEILAAHVSDPAPRPSDIEASVPPELDELVLRLLAKNPADRHPSAEALLAALDAVRLGTLPKIVAVGTADGGDGSPRARASSKLSTLSDSVRAVPGRSGAESSHSWLVVAATALAVLLVGGAGLMLFGGDGEHDSARAATPVVRTEGTPVASAVTRPARSPAASAVRPAPQPVLIEVRSEPPGATVLRLPEKTIVGKTPYHYALDARPGTLELRVELDGYEPRTVSFSTSDGGTRHLELEAVSHRGPPENEADPGDATDDAPAVAPGAAVLDALDLGPIAEPAGDSDAAR